MLFCSLRQDNIPRAYGVRFRHGKNYLIAKAHREVILSAGAVASPQILMLSGIGPAYHLQHLGIPVVADLQVGKSMQSHVGTGEIVFTIKKPVSFDPLRYARNPGKNIIPYFTRRGEGPLSSSAGFESIGNIRTGLDNTTRLISKINFLFFYCYFFAIALLY
jgi:choline dehydrogenase-like flavoprotein